MKSMLKLLMLAISCCMLFRWWQSRAVGSTQHLGLDLREFPKGIVNQYDEERDFLNYHRCSNEGEAFAGSWLVTKEHFTAYNVSYGLSEANAELAFFLVMETRRSKKAWAPVGALMQTLDVLDLSVIHLSAYERLYRQYTYDLQEPAVSDEIHGSMTRAVERIRTIARRRSIVMTASSPLSDPPTMSFKDTYNWLLGRPLHKPSSTPSRISISRADSQPRVRRTLAMLPWLGSSKGVGHSETTFRLLYLEACFWSVTQVTPHIVVGVTTKQDHDLVTGAGLPALDIVILADLPSPQALPAALVQHVRLGADSGGAYSTFSYFYYSESDQVLVAHQAARSAFFDFLDKYPRRVLVPHRLVPYPPAIVELLNRSTRQPHSRVFHSPKVLNDFGHAEKSTISAKEMFTALRDWFSSGETTSSSVAAPDWETNKCCLPRQNCEQRGDWVAPADPSLPFIEVHGLPVALGNANFKAERFRPCTLSPLGGLCP